jgi:hypothetical protein
MIELIARAWICAVKAKECRDGWGIVGRCEIGRQGQRRLAWSGVDNEGGSLAWTSQSVVAVRIGGACWFEGEGKSNGERSIEGEGSWHSVNRSQGRDGFEGEQSEQGKSLIRRRTKGVKARGLEEEGGGGKGDIRKVEDGR